MRVTIVVGRFAGVSLLALLVAVSAVAADGDAENYEIRLTRPDAVGDRFKLSGEGALIRKTVVIAGDQRREQEPSGSGIKLDGTAEVLAVTPKGKVTKL